MGNVSLYETETDIEESKSSTPSESYEDFLNEIDLIENGADEQEARLHLGKAILDYSNDYYDEYETYSHSPNRKGHIPYIFKALIMDSADKIGESIICQDGKN